MNQRTLMLAATAITAFLLVVMGGVAARVIGQPESVASATATASSQALEPTLQAALSEREAAYEQALAEANARLEQANERIAQANARIAATNVQRQQAATAANPSVAAATAANPSVAAVPTKNISPEQAARIALAAVPGATLRGTPELVSFRGVPAYEVVLNQGTLYIDAQSGQILANAAQQPAVEAPRYNDDDHDDDDGHDDDDDKHNDNDDKHDDDDDKHDTEYDD